MQRASIDRRQLQERLDRMGDDHPYVRAVREVNGQLLEREVPMGDNIAGAVDRTLTEIETATGSAGAGAASSSRSAPSATTAHAREVDALARDTAASARAGDIKGAAISGAGSVANIFAFFGAGAAEASNYKTGAEFRNPSP